MASSHEPPRAEITLRCFLFAVAYSLLSWAVVGVFVWWLT